MMSREEAPVALVTGASRGIGRAIAVALAEAGHDVAVNYRADQSSADAVVRRIMDQGRRAAAIQADVRELDQVTAMVDRAESEIGPISVLINNAGVLLDKPAAFISDAEWDEVLDTNLKGAFHCIKILSRGMARRKHGRIINIASNAGLGGDVPRAAYAASKAGIVGLTRAMARELAISGITVNAVSPGLIETEMVANMKDAKRSRLTSSIPLGRFGTPEEVARVVVFLASAQSAYITGQVLCADGGMRMKTV